LSQNVYEHVRMHKHETYVIEKFKVFWQAYQYWRASM